MEKSEKTIDTLNNLILINNDRIEGYENALKEMEKREGNSGLEKRYFLKFISDSRRYIRELGNKIRYLRQTIRERAAATHKMRHIWNPLKNPFTSRSRQSLLGDCESGENSIEKAYRDTLNKIDAGPFTNELLRTQQAELLNAHDEVKVLRDRKE